MTEPATSPSPSPPLESNDEPPLPPPNPPLAFPPHPHGPRTWLFTAATAPVAIAVARALLEHSADNVVLGLPDTVLKREIVVSRRRARDGDNEGRQSKEIAGSSGANDSQAGHDTDSGVRRSRGSSSTSDDGSADARENKAATTTRTVEGGGLASAKKHRKKDNEHGGHSNVDNGFGKGRPGNSIVQTKSRNEFNWQAAMESARFEGERERWEDFANFWTDVCGGHHQKDDDMGHVSHQPKKQTKHAVNIQSVRLEGEEMDREQVDREVRGWENQKESGNRAGWRNRCKLVALNGRNMGQCQSAVAETVLEYGKVDVLFCCASEALIGTVEELAASPRTQNLVREQIETNFFGSINCIKATLPAMRHHNNGHVIVLTGITGHLGTPGLGMYCAAGWALEGYCDSLAYEVAPFNIKVTIVQPNLEINVLTNKITAAPSLPEYAPQNNPAPLSRDILGGLLDHIEGKNPQAAFSNKSQFASADIHSVYPQLPVEMKFQLLAETVHAVIAIGGHDNPPARHIVGLEGVTSVKEKLKTVSEELEDFVEVSCAVDIDESDDVNGSEALLDDGGE